MPIHSLLDCADTACVGSYFKADLSALTHSTKMSQAEGEELSNDEEEDDAVRGGKNKPAARTKKRKKERGRARNPFIDDAAAEDDDEASCPDALTYLSHACNSTD